MGVFKKAHGGVLKDLYLHGSAIDEEKVNARDYKSWNLTEHQLCDLELLLNGAFSPLDGFLTREEYDGVVENMRLPSGVLWPMPITLDVSQKFAETLSDGENIALRNPEGVIIATVQVSDIWTPDKDHEAKKVFGTTDQAHPGVNYLMNQAGAVYLGGKLKGVEPHLHYDFKLLRHAPAELRSKFEELGWRRIVAFQTRNPMHRAHQELTFRAARENEANLLIQPIVGMSKPGDVDHYTRVRCYEVLLKQYPEQTTSLSLLNLAMRMGGPREALWHGIVRKNYGCTHFIIGRDHAGPGMIPAVSLSMRPTRPRSYSPSTSELDITMVPSRRWFTSRISRNNRWTKSSQAWRSRISAERSSAAIARRTRYSNWFSYPSARRAAQAVPPAGDAGFHRVLHRSVRLGEIHHRQYSFGQAPRNGRPARDAARWNLVRKHLPASWDYKEHRDLNIQRIGYVALRSPRPAA